MNLEKLIKIAGAVAPIVIAIIGYSFIEMNPILRVRSNALAVGGVFISALWVWRNRQKHSDLRFFVMSILLALLAYGALRFLITFFDLNPPAGSLATLADVLIECAYAIFFSILTVACGTQLFRVVTKF